MVSILGRQRGAIFDAVRGMYSEVAARPTRGFHFPVGREACSLVGYPADVVAGLPTGAVESFAGVGYPFAAGGIRDGDTVLDIGVGSGTDALVASARVGGRGQVLGLDFTPEMLSKLRRNVRAAGVRNVRGVQGNAEEIPLADGSVDLVTSNGVLNLVPDKERALAEIHRVLRPTGGLQIADIALGSPLTPECTTDPQLWAECVVGAVLESRYEEMLRQAGFVGVRILGRFDYFAASSSPETRSIARSLNAHSIVMYASKSAAGEGRWNPGRWPAAGGAHLAAHTDDVSSADAVLEVYGAGCGTVEPLLRDHLRGLASGQVLELRSDHPELRLGIPAWCRLSGNHLVHTATDDEARTRFYIRRK